MMTTKAPSGMQRFKDRIFSLFRYEVSMPFMLRVGLAFLVPVIAGTCHFNWVVTERLYIIGGLYADKCPEGTKMTEYAEGTMTCKAQEAAVNRIYAIIIATQFGFSLLGGYLTDHLPPKLASASGLLVRLLGFMIILTSSPMVPIHLVGAACIGMAADWSFLSLFSLSNTCPEKKGMIISILGAARSVSFVMPTLIAFVARRFEIQYLTAVGWSHVLFISVAISIVMIVLPAKSLAEAQGEEALAEATELLPGQTAEVPKTLKQLLMTKKFLLILPYAVINIMRPTYLISIASRILPRTADAFALVGTLSFLPCPLFGWIIDKYTIFPVLHIINGAGTISVAAALFREVVGGSIIAEWIIIMSHNIAMSFLISQLYCYIASLFPAQKNGTLIGILCAFVGALSYLNSFLYQLGQDIGVSPLLWGFLAASVAASVLAMYLWYAFKPEAVARTKAAAAIAALAEKPLPQVSA